MGMWSCQILQTVTIMSVHRLEEQWKKALEQLTTWKESRDRALAQLSSIHNLASQLEAVHKCRTSASSELGVVAKHPLCVQLLEAKLMQAMERAYSCAVKERRVLHEVVQKLQKCAKEGQKSFTNSVEHDGLEEMSCRSCESFSGADYLTWLNELHCHYRADLEKKLSAIDSLKYTTQSAGQVCAVWEREPVFSSHDSTLSLDSLSVPLNVAVS